MFEALEIVISSPILFNLPLIELLALVIFNVSPIIRAICLVVPRND